LLFIFIFATFIFTSCSSSEVNIHSDSSESSILNSDSYQENTGFENSTSNFNFFQENKITFISLPSNFYLTKKLKSIFFIYIAADNNLSDYVNLDIKEIIDASKKNLNTAYFVFIDVTDKALIDGEYLSAELIAAAFEIPLETVKESWSIDLELDQKPTLKTYLEENGALAPFNKQLFSETALNAMHCEERYAYRDGYYRFSFDYENERNANFEFHGKL